MADRDLTGQPAVIADALEGIEDLLANGTGSQRQLKVYEANHDLREVMKEIVAATAEGLEPRDTAPAGEG